MKTNFELIKEFHEKFGREQDPQVPSVEKIYTLDLRVKLITEEFKEFLEEVGYILPFDPRIANYPKCNHNDGRGIELDKLAKELSDLLYVIYGTAATFGIPIDDVYREVHRSNMSKLDENGNVLRREDGKVLKGPNYKEPDIKKVLYGKSSD